MLCVCLVVLFCVCLSLCDCVRMLLSACVGLVESVCACMSDCGVYLHVTNSVFICEHVYLNIQLELHLCVQ